MKDGRMKVVGTVKEVVRAVLAVLARAVLRRAAAKVAGKSQGATQKKAASQLRPTLGSVNTGPGGTTEAIPLPACRSGEG